MTTINMRYPLRISLGLLLVLLFCPVDVRAQTGTCNEALGEAFLDINNVRARILNNGNLFWRGDPHVYEVPKGGGESAIFASGIWIGGQIDGQLRLAGSTYGPYEFWAGPIEDINNPPSNCRDFDTVWKVSVEDVISYDATGSAPPDLRTWPTGLGAPTLDADGNEIVLQPDGTLEHINAEGEVVSTEVLSFAERVNRSINLGAGERPLILGDQMLWWIMNDLGNTHARTGGLPIGLEVHVSAFAFNTSGAIGNTTFYRYRMFYKGDRPLVNTYMGIFSDPDLGLFTDDYVGSDTTLGLGYVYNADNDDEGHYGLNPPALGYDFFQGPLVDNDGIDNDGDGEIDEPGERLQMTAFVYYNNSGDVTGDPQNAEEYYNYMRARWRDGQRITEGGNGRDFSQIPTNFMFPGDPVTQSYWTELNADGAGTAIDPADRRFVMATGPFTIEPGDMQEIVFGIIWSRGSNHLDSVRKLREDDALAQQVFDIGFQLPSPPNAPQVTTTPLDGRVILTWENRPSDNNYLERYRVIDPLLSEDVEDNDYVFEGYNVYQFDSPQDQDGTLLAVYDVPNGITRVIEGTDLTFVTAEGTDAGVQHFHTVTGLTNYQEYYFGVQAYAYNEPSGRKVYAGPIQRVSAIPTKVDARSGGTLLSEEATRAADQSLITECEGVQGGFDLCAAKDGLGGGFVAAEVVNPTVVTGDQYVVSFYETCVETAGKNAVVALADDEKRPGLDGRVPAKAAAQEECFTTYDITNTTTGTKVFDGAAAAQATGAAPPQGSRVQVFDGLSFTISGPPPEFLDINQVDDDGNFLTSLDFSLSAPPSDGDRTFFISAQGAGGPADILGRIDWQGQIAAGAPNEFELRFVENPEENGQIALSYLLDPGDPNLLMLGWKEGPELADDGSYAETERGNGRMPFQIWKLDPVSGTEEQILVAVLDDNADGFWGINPALADVAFGNAAGAYERIYAFDIPYSEDNFDADWDAAWAGFPATANVGRVNFVPFGGHANPPAPGTNVRFVTSKPNLPGDTFTLSTEGFGVTEDNVETARNALDLIGITPNPYKGASAYELNQLNDLVRFTNLPRQATLRIFTLSGTLIRTIQKNSPQAFLEWNLTTEDDLPIASGVYLIHVDVPGVGERVLKFSVVKKRPQLNAF